MVDRVKTARALIRIALDTFREEILADLPADKRYQGAMTANALAIAARSLEGGDPADELASRLGAPGASLEALGRAIRAGEISDAAHPSLRSDLLDYLRAELGQTNPRFLAGREA